LLPQKNNRGNARVRLDPGRLVRPVKPFDG
jgi:hypothetical protein